MDVMDELHYMRKFILENYDEKVIRKFIKYMDKLNLDYESLFDLFMYYGAIKRVEKAFKD